jgi:glyoxylase-like metal-dependent hydrolase (beta-lactamase superfamily II)
MIHTLGDKIVNWYLVEEGGRLTAVDAGLPGHAKTLADDLAAIGKRPEDVEAVVLTHSDSDHTGVAPVLREAGARVLIHADDKATLRKPGPKDGDGAPRHLVKLMWRPRFWRFASHMVRHGGGRPKGIEGAETFADGDVLDVPGRPRVIHTPGHTPGHSAFLFEGERALFAGDSLCTWNPLTDEREPQVMPKPFNTDYAQCFESLGRLEEVDAGTLLAGHGESFQGDVAGAVKAARARNRPA